MIGNGTGTPVVSGYINATVTTSGTCITAQPTLLATTVPVPKSSPSQMVITGSASAMMVGTGRGRILVEMVSLFLLSGGLGWGVVRW